MVTVAADTAVTIPEVLPTVAMAVLPLYQVPPVVASVKVVVPPAHTATVPLIALGAMFTVITSVTLQPVDNI